MNEEKITKLLDLVAEQTLPNSPVLGSDTKISESAFYDFTEHYFLMPPLSHINDPTLLFNAIKSAVREGLAQEISWRYEVRGERDFAGGTESEASTRNEQGYTDDRVTNILINSSLMESVLIGLTETLGDLPSWSSFEGNKLLKALTASFMELFKRWTDWSKTDDYNSPWVTILKQLKEKLQSNDGELSDEVILRVLQQYGNNNDNKTQSNFEIYPIGSVNFGLQPVYRQVWTPLGVQKGEIVRTLPLGPKQTEKISVKITRRTKASNSRETTTSRETNEETKETIKDSSEVVLEAAESSNYNISASASYGLPTGGFGASVDASTGGESSNSSRDTKTLLNDSMMQASSKIRRDTKVSVTTESENTSEFISASEITNPNDEIAVTYVYSKLQRQYEISTYLAELNTVVYVAEHVPNTMEMDQKWFQTYGAIIRKVLLDASLDNHLNIVLAGKPSKFVVNDKISSGFSKLITDSPNYSETRGTPPDPLSSMTQSYERELQQLQESIQTRERFENSIETLRCHLIQNILHYCRAIWMDEDPQARVLRYRHIKVPTKWKSQNLSSGYTPPRKVRPDYRNPVGLSEMIDPTGPIGFSGNYAVYRLKQHNKWSDLLGFINQMRLPYLKVIWYVTSDEERYPNNYNVTVAVSPQLLFDRDFLVSYSDQELYVEELKSSGRNLVKRQELSADGGLIMVVNQLKLTITPKQGQSLLDGDKFTLHIRILPHLEDPELKQIRWTTTLPSQEVEHLVYSRDVLRRMVAFMPDLLPSTEELLEWDLLPEDEKELFRESYHEYLMHEEHSRHLLLDANNLVLSRIVDSTSSLEPFKSAHRYIDALSAAEKVRHEELENERLEQRINKGIFTDPDTEKVVVIDSDKVDTNIDPI